MGAARILSTANQYMGRHLARVQAARTQLCHEERIFILMTSDRKLRASREGSKCRIHGT